MFTLIDRVEFEHTVELHLASDDINLSEDPRKYDRVVYVDKASAEKLQIGDYIDGEKLYVFRNI